MPTTLTRPRLDDRPIVADTFSLEDSSPFGLQGLRREGLKLLKSDCIGKLAFRLAMRGGKKEVQRDVLAEEIMQRHPEWVEEYEVVHLIEKSLWINGRSDLVMTLEKNPSQIPDSPPPEILAALTRANTLHPKATVWYGVPLFGDETTADGLPLPLSAQEVREEHRRRIRAAQSRAMKFGWLYKMGLRAVGLPFAMRRLSSELWRHLKAEVELTRKHLQQIRRDARRRRSAKAIREMEYMRYGRFCTPMPEHSTLLGRVASRAMSAAEIAERNMARHGTLMGATGATFAMAQILPMIFVPMTVVSCDPFLFVELPEEPGKLRHIGHWYWQGPRHGEQTLHVHI
jgi:hypothetical protein